MCIDILHLCIYVCMYACMYSVYSEKRIGNYKEFAWRRGANNGRRGRVRRVVYKDKNPSFSRRMFGHDRLPAHAFNLNLNSSPYCLRHGEIQVCDFSPLFYSFQRKNSFLSLRPIIILFLFLTHFLFLRVISVFHLSQFRDFYLILI